MWNVFLVNYTNIEWNGKVERDSVLPEKMVLGTFK